MRVSGICPKCRGTDIRGPHGVLCECSLRVDLPGVLTATLESFTCASCGYTELYADNLGLQNLRSKGRPLNVVATPLPVVCPVCETELKPGQKRCPRCGYSVAQ